MTILTSAAHWLLRCGPVLVRFVPGRAARGLAGAIAFASAVSLGAMATPQEATAMTQWELGCSIKPGQGETGNGHAIAADYCRRLAECRDMAKRGPGAPGQAVPGALATGCFGFEDRPGPW